MKTTIILACESRSTIDNTALREISRFEHDLSSDSASIALRRNQLHTNPVVGAVWVIAIQNGTLILIGDNHVERTVIRQIGKRNCTAIVFVVGSDFRCYIYPARDAAIDVDARRLISRQARIPKCRPVSGILEHAPLAPAILDIEYQ